VDFFAVPDAALYSSTPVSAFKDIVGYLLAVVGVVLRPALPPAGHESSCLRLNHVRCATRWVFLSESQGGRSYSTCFLVLFLTNLSSVASKGLELIQI